MEEVTAQFLRLYTNPPRPRARVLFVPGIFTRWYPHYFTYAASGIPRENYRALPINTEAKRADVARSIRDAVLAEPEPVILLGQSKGPCDAHAALVLHPEIVPRVKALVSIQAPFRGTPLAEVPPWFAPRALEEIRYDERAKFLAQHPGKVPVPCVALATTTLQAGWPLETTRKLIVQKTGQPSDGFVAERDAELPGARMVRLAGVDHASIALPWLRKKPAYDPVRVVLALLALAA